MSGVCSFCEIVDLCGSYHRFFVFVNMILPILQETSRLEFGFR